MIETDRKLKETVLTSSKLPAAQFQLLIPVPGREGGRSASERSTTKEVQWRLQTRLRIVTDHGKNRIAARALDLGPTADGSVAEPA